MKIKPKFEQSVERKLIGKKLVMSLADNRISELWREFNKMLVDVPNRINEELVSASVYPHNYFEAFDPTIGFERWAAAEVKDFDSVPPGMETLVIPAGLYVVFNYKGLSTDNSVFQYIYETWFPNSGYAPDSRPHFEILGKNYNNHNAQSEEQIWIPVKKREGSRS